MAVAKTPAKILRVLGNPDPLLERTHIGIYDALDQLTSLAFTTSVNVNTNTIAPAAYTTIATVGFPFTQRSIANFKGVFLIQDNPLTLSTDIDIGLFSTTIKGLTPSSPGGTTSFLRADGTWAVPAGGGITQLTGDVTAGPGAGSVVATLANIPNATPAAGYIQFAATSAPGTPPAGKLRVWADSASKNFKQIDDGGFVSAMVFTQNAVASKWFTSFDSSTSIFGTAQPAFTDISGTLGGAQLGPLTGDVTTSGYVATLANIPSDTPMAGDLLATAMAAPGAPAAGKGRIYFDSTSLNIAAKGTGGVVNHGIQTRTATANNWIRSIADDGTTTISQPAFADILGTLSLSQLGNGSALSVLGVAGNASATRADIASSAGSGFALRESSNTIGFGALATGAYGANSVTYAKIQTTAAGSVLLGRGNAGAGNVQELTVTGAAKITAGTLDVPLPTTMTWGGFLGSVGTQLVFSSFYLGIGDNSWSTSTTFGFIIPNNTASTIQEWGIRIFANTFVGTGTPGFQVTLMINGSASGVLAGFLGSGTVPDGAIVSTTQTISGGDSIGIRISVSSGTINGGSLGIYVVGRFR